MSDPVSLVLSKLPDAKPAGDGKWTARCPAHDDRRPSLSLAKGDDGRALVKCHAGCSTYAILKAMDLETRDLFVLTVDTTPKSQRTKRVVSTRTNGNGKPPKVFPTCAAAVDALEQQRGKRQAAWTYQNADGEPVGMIVRWDWPDGTKDIWPVSRHDDGWRIAAMPELRPLYRLPELATAPRVVVCEGEKAADAARPLGFTATTSAGGCSAASKSDWRPLAGNEVWILPDNDAAGRKYADSVAAILEGLTPKPRVRVVELPGLPDGGDIVEFIQAERAMGSDDASIRAKIETLANDAQQAETTIPPPPAVEPWRPFPTTALPEPARSFVEATARAIGCDAAFVALPLLAVLASCIGNTRRIRLKRSWTEPSIVWAVIIGESGTGKSAPIDAVLSPLSDRQRKAIKEYDKKMEDHKREMMRHKKAVAKWEKNATDGPAPDAPIPPICERLYCDDVTIEAVGALLQNRWRGMLLKRDELAGWLGSFDRYSGGKGRCDAAKWLEMHGGRPFINDRKTSGNVHVPMASLSVTGGIQPAILQRAIGQEHRENGLLARLLLAMPPRAVRRWTEADVDESIERAMRELVDSLLALEPAHNEDGEPEPIDVSMTAEAKAVWVAFYDNHAQEHVELTGDLSAAWSKLEGYAARLALVVHCVRLAACDPTLTTPDKVDAASIQAGIDLAKWFAHETRRVYAILSEDEGQKGRRELAELIERKGGTATARDLQRWRPRDYRTSDAAQIALKGLVEAGLGAWAIDDHGGKGGRPVERFSVFQGQGNDTTPRNHCENGVVSVVNTQEGPEIEPVADPEGETEWMG